jgi:hypothetical protein
MLPGVHFAFKGYPANAPRRSLHYRSQALLSGTVINQVGGMGLGREPAAGGRAQP